MITVKRRILLALTTLVMLVCLSFGVVACKKNKGKDAFAVPANLTVTGNILSWDEVSGAASYTVKINSDETTTTEGTSLDLTTVTAKLVSGDNSLYVKTNATDEKNASEYSAAVTYNYSPVTQLAAPVVTLNGNTLSWNEVSGATEGYTVKIGTHTLAANSTSLDLTAAEVKLLLKKGENTISVKANAAGGLTESVYSNEVIYNHVLTPEEEAAEFIASVEAIDQTVTLSSAEEIELAREKYETLSDEAKEIEGMTSAISTLAEKECAYFAALVNELSVEGLDKGISLTQKNEKDAELEKISAYYENLLDEDGAADAYAAYGQKKSAYENLLDEIAEEVNGLAAEIEAMDLGNEITLTGGALLEYYNELLAVQDEIDGLGGYAASLLDGGLVTAIDGEIEAVLKIPYETNANESAVFINRDHGAKSEIYVIVTFKNVRGDALAVSVAPTLTVDGVEDINGEKVTYNATAKCYVYVVSFTCPEVDDTVEVTYQIGNGQPVTKTVAYPSSIIYSSDTDYKFIQGGVLTCYGVHEDTPLFADVYDASAISATGRDQDISVNADKLATISIANGMTEDALKTAIAREDILGDGLKLRLVIYEFKDGVYSTINSSCVSETLTYSLGEDDKLTRIPFTVVNGALEITSDGGFICGSDLNYELIIASFGDADIATADDARGQLNFHVYVLKNHVEVGDFYADIPGNGTLDGATVKRYVYNFCGDTASGDVVTLRVAISLKEGSTYSDILRESLASPEKVWNFKATIEDTQLPLASVLTNGRWSVGNGETIVYQWEATTTNRELHDGINIYVYIVGNKDAQTYDFVANDKPLTVYNDTSGGYIYYANIEKTIKQALSKLPASEKVENYTFVFVMISEVNEAGVAAGYSDSAPVYATLSTNEDTRDTKSVSIDWAVPEGNLIGFNTEGTVFTVLEENQPGLRGSIFDETYGVEYIEFIFTYDGETYTAYLIKGEEYEYGAELFDNRLTLYSSLDTATAVAQSCERVANGWMNVGDFINWANLAYGITLDGTLSGVEFSTKIVHDGTYFVGEGQVSSPITCPAANA